MELADVTDSKSVGLITRVGSSPTTGTNLYGHLGELGGLEDIPVLSGMSSFFIIMSRSIRAGPGAKKQVCRLQEGIYSPEQDALKGEKRVAGYRVSRHSM